jgi:pimeloyl-ACP methyl ester carboxylesterase
MVPAHGWSGRRGSRWILGGLLGSLVGALAAAVPPAAPVAPVDPVAERIAVGGRTFELVRSGRGSPTVVFESGLGASLDAWRRFLPAVARTTTVVAYSRAGEGASDPATAPRPPAAVAGDLHALLHQAGLKPPYVLVGHSVGVLYIRAFAQKYPREVSGLVLIDGTPEGWIQGMRRIDPVHAALQLRQLAASRAAGFPEQGNSGAREEWAGLYDILLSGNLGVPGTLPDVPMIVITGLRPDGTDPRVLEMKRELQGEVFRATTQGMHIVTSRSGHAVPQEEPELVERAITWTVDAARARPPRGP